MNGIQEVGGSIPPGSTILRRQCLRFSLTIDNMS
jgi:hypothetical protein